MRTVELGRSGLRVSNVCLGTMAFGRSLGAAEAGTTLDAFADAGGTFLDTGAVFGGGASDEVLRSVLRGRRFVVSAKFGRALGDQRSGPTVDNLRHALDTTLRRLGIDVIDLMLVHGWPGSPALEEVAWALDEARRSGKVRAVGVADAPAWACARLHTLGERSGHFRVDASLVEYGLAARDAERELLPMAADLGASTLAWGTTSGDLLLGAAPSGYYGRIRAPAALRLRPLVERIARELGRSPVSVVLGWLTAAAPSVIPLLGATSAADLTARLDALGTSLPSETVAALSEASALPLGFPHDYLADADVRAEFGLP